MEVSNRPALPLRLPAAAWLAAALIAPAPAGADDAALPAGWRELVAAAVLPAVQRPQPQAQVEIEVGTPDPRLRLASCRRVEVQLPATVPGSGAAPLWGRSRVGLRCAEGDKRWLVWLPLTVKVRAPALVASRTLPAGTVLQAADLATAPVDWAADGGTPFDRAPLLLGRTLSRPLAAGQAPRAADLRQRQWFAAGETVQVLARGDGFVVSGEAEALAPGIDGQPVRVRTESGRVLSVLPVGERRVELKL